MDKIVLQILRFGVKKLVRFRQRLNSYHCQLYTLYSGVTLNLGKGCLFNVPVKINGKGKVIIGPNVSFGYRLSPMLGDGTILIQARESEAIVELG